MANFHSDEWIMARLDEHYEEAKTLIDESRIVGLFCQGSQNYGLDYEGSDIDTKLIIAPTFKDIAFNKKPISTTHVRQNNEHIDLKDVRLYIETFRKQNLNFLEILFTPYKIVNPQYAEFWQNLVDAREAIAHYDIHRSIKSMKGIALEKYHAMEHKYPSKVDIIEKYSYDPKQLHHLLRVEDYLIRYINGESYEDCLNPKELSQYLIEVKQGKYSIEEARQEADRAINNINQITENFINNTENVIDFNTDLILNQVQYEIMKNAITMELMEGK